MNARDACIRSVTALSLSRQSINQSITSHQSHQQSFEPARKPPPNAYPATRCRPRDGRACTPSVSMRVPPSMRVPRVHTYPFHPPSRRSRTRRSGHVHGPRAGERARPPPTTQKTKKKEKSPPPPFTNAKINTHGGGRRRIQPTRGSVRSPRAPACAMDNDRCHVSGPCGSCVPSTRTGHDSRKNDTPTTDRAYASASPSASPFPLVRSTSRVVSARRTCAFDSLDASNAVDRHPSHLDPRRLRASASTSRRARDANENPARRPTERRDGHDRRRRPTMSRYGRKGVDTVRAGASRRERDDRSARGGATSRVARGPARASTTTATEA